MQDMRVLTVRVIRDIMTLLDQESQDLIDRLTSLTGENALGCVRGSKSTAMPPG